MGGNAIFDGHSAVAIHIRSQADRDLITERIRRLLVAISVGVEMLSDDYLWPQGWNFDHFLSGSTVHLFDESIATSDLMKFKSHLGDIDIMFDAKRQDDVIRFLRLARNLEGFRLLGWSHIAGTIVTMWYDGVTDQNYQVDLEPEEFVDGVPSEWARFSRSSSWDDSKIYIKGVAHKYIFRAMTAMNLIETNVQLKTKKKREKITPYVFSPKGARIKYLQIGKDLWEEIPMKDSHLVRNVHDLFCMFFDRQPKGNDESKMWSYTGVVELIRLYIDPSKHRTILDGMFHLLWGLGAQGIVRDDRSADWSVKMSIYRLLLDDLSIPEDAGIHATIDAYYENY